MSKKNKCYFCEAESEIVNFDSNLKYVCPNCGTYELSLAFRHWLDTQQKNYQDQQKAFIAGYLYETKVAVIDEQDIRRDPKLIDKLEFKNILNDSLIPHTLSEKLEKILKYINEESTYFGEYIRIIPQVGYTNNVDELEAMLNALLERNYINGLDDIKVDGDPEFGEYSLTLSGVEFLVENAKNENQNECFIAMKFCEETRSLFEEAIEPGCCDAGYRAIRVDRQIHTDYITNQIIADIRKAKFVIADFTFQNQGVYYEAGFARGLGKQVIQMCRADHFEKKTDEKAQENDNKFFMHFDTMQINTIRWENGKEAENRKPLKDWIESLFGHGDFRCDQRT